MFSLKVFLIFTVALFVILALEQIIPRIANVDFDFYNNFLLPKLIFISIAIISLVIQYFIIGYITKSYERKGELTRIPILVLQSLTTILMIIVVLNVVENNRYGSHNFYQVLGWITGISYLTAIFFLALLACKFLKFYKINLKIGSLLYGLAFCSLTINAILQCISLSILLGNFLFLPINAPEGCGGFEIPPRCPSIQLSLQVTWIISFLLLWASSILLLYRNKTLLGKRFWTIASMPVILLIHYIFPFLGLSLFDLVGIITLSYIFIVLYLVGKFLTAYIFGTSIWTIRKTITDNTKRDLVLIAGIGLFFYVLSINQTISLPLEGFHPLSGVPYGIVTLSLAGLFAYMVSSIRIDEVFLNKEIS